MMRMMIAGLAAFTLTACNPSATSTPMVVSQASDPAQRALDQLMLNEGVAVGLSDACPTYAARPGIDARIIQTLETLLGQGYTPQQLDQIAERGAAKMETATTQKALFDYVARQRDAAGPGATACDVAAREVATGTPVGQLLVRR